MFHLGMLTSPVCGGAAYSWHSQGFQGLAAPPGSAELLWLTEMTGLSWRDHLASQCQRGAGTSPAFPQVSASLITARVGTESTPRLAAGWVVLAFSSDRVWLVSRTGAGCKGVARAPATGWVGKYPAHSPGFGQAGAAAAADMKFPSQRVLPA